MSSHTTVLRVESGLILHVADRPPASGQVLEHHVPSQPWRGIEKMTRLHVQLALRARRFADQCDVVWAGNEQVGIPLSFLRLRKPLVVVAHHLESPLRASLAALSGAVRRWDGVGYISDEGKQFLIDRLHVPAERLFQYESAKYLCHALLPTEASDGPIVSVGVAERDYPTLLAALAELRGCDTEIFPSSKFGDGLMHRVSSWPDWVRLMGWVSDDEILQRYRRARFVVVPLQRTTHGGAGINAALEASALGKAVIATRTGGMPTFVKDGETGILVPPDDVPALRDAIRYLWAEPAVAARMGTAGRRYMEQRFNPQTVDDNIVAFLDNLQERATKR